MKSKALIAVAVASTFGWSAASFAGPGLQSVMPSSPNESGQNVFTYERSFGGDTPASVMRAMSNDGSVVTGDSFNSSSSNLPTTVDESASIGTDENLAATNEGLYTDYYVVGFAPAIGHTWDYYVLDTDATPSMIAITDLDADQLALVPSSSEVVYELALIPITFDDGGLSTSTGDLSGE